MGYKPKPREERIELLPYSHHPGGDCNCRERTIHTGRFMGGSEACGRCLKLIGRRTWHQPERRPF